MMRKANLLWVVFGFLLVQGISSAMATDLSGYQLAANDERYGCCLVKTDNKMDDVWEYEDDITFITCYKWARLIGDPLQFFNDRKYEFYEARRCSSVNSKHELIPSLWSPAHRSG
ncbi:MAG TPA: hypothetical protein P5260_07900 [Candidatus Competibacter sp.]|jgi:hypothetical protein|nr:hypothetical protein [Candidatus Competibacter sp.]HRX61126.1 hypothetical protein [Candidatus Competibacter sp.]